MGKGSWRPGRVMKDPRGYLEPQEVTQVISQSRCERDRLLMELLWQGGPRISEALLFKPQDVTRDGALILATLKRKGEPETRSVPVKDSWLNDMRTFARTHQIGREDYLFRGRTPDSHMHRSTAYRIVRSACERAGFDRIGLKPPHCHHFRHSMAIDFYKRTDGDLRSLQLILGHDSIVTTSGYLMFISEDVLAAQHKRWAQ